MTTASTTPTPTTAESVAAITATLDQLTTRIRRRLAGQDLPATRQAAELFLRQDPGGLRRLVSLVHEASVLVGACHTSMGSAAEAHRDLTTEITDNETLLAGMQTVIFEDLRRREHLAATITSSRKALDDLAHAMDGAGEVFRLFEREVGAAVETLLVLDAEYKRRRLRDVLAQMRASLDSIRQSATEHDALRAAWEKRLGLKFTVPEISE